MTDPRVSSGPIPYRLVHDGPRRLLHLQLKRALWNTGAVHVTIDGWPHVLGWGPAIFEIPADRPVTIRVHQFDVLQRVFGNAEVVLAPWAPAVLEYQAPAHPSQMGELGPPGTVSVRGKRTYMYLGCMGLLARPTETSKRTSWPGGGLQNAPLPRASRVCGGLGQLQPVA